MQVSCGFCKNRYVKGSGIAFHRFPLKNAALCTKWVLATRRQNFVPDSCNFICSSHFVDGDYYPRLVRNVCGLKANAVPSVFEFLPPNAFEGGVVDNTESSISSPGKSKTEDQATPKPTAGYTDSYKRIIQLLVKVKSLQQQTRRQNIRIENMKEELRSYKDKEKVEMVKAEVGNESVSPDLAPAVVEEVVTAAQLAKIKRIRLGKRKSTTLTDIDNNQKHHKNNHKQEINLEVESVTPNANSTRLPFKMRVQNFHETFLLENFL